MRPHKKTRWCVKWLVRNEQGSVHKERWCALEKNKRPPVDGDHFRAETLCEHFVILPGAYEKRVPDCEECLALLEAK
jgi:hypothetical protein